jgi:type IV pilus assembly protein PilQ
MVGNMRQIKQKAILFFIILLSLGAISKSQISTSPPNADSSRTIFDSSTFANGASDILQQRIVDTNIIIPTLDFAGMNLRDALVALTRAYQLSVYLDSSVIGTISLRLDNVLLNDALLFIIKEYQLSWERTGAVVKIFKPKAIPTPPQPLDIKYDGNYVSFNLENADLSQFVKEVIGLTSKNIIIDEGARGNITGHLVNIEFEKGMKAILNSNGLTLAKIEDIYHVGYLEKTGEQGKKVSRYLVSCQGDSITIDVRSAPISDILTTLSDECKLSIIAYGKIEGTITASYKDQPLSDVLGFILRGTPYSFKKDNNIYFVGDKASENLFTSKLIKFKHITNTSIQDLLPATLTKAVSIKGNLEQNGIIITGPTTAIQDIESFLNEIDIPPAQVLFDAVVVDYNISNYRNFNLTADNTGLKTTLPNQNYFPNIDYSSTGDNLNIHLDNIADYLKITNIGHLSSDFYMRLRIMVEKGVANIVSRPQIAALNGHPASIKIGTSQYYLLESKTIYPSDQTSVSSQTSQRFEVIEADMSLDVTPWVTQSGEIIVDIKPEFNTPASAFDPDIPPTINRRILKSTVRLRDGETIILGGMIQNQENVTIKKFPILGDIPILGRLFQNRSSTKTSSELMVYLTPHVYYGSEGSVDINKILKQGK